MIENFSLCRLSGKRQEKLVDCLKRTYWICGATAEIGIGSGGTSRAIALSNNNVPHWACDTFLGLVDVDKSIEQHLDNGRFKYARKETEERFEGISNIIVVEGYFPDSAPQAMKDSIYKLVHIDVDTYQSTRGAWEFFRSRMVKSGVIIIDDALDNKCKGAMKFWNEVKDGLNYIENTPQVVVYL